MSQIMEQYQTEMFTIMVAVDVRGAYGPNRVKRLLHWTEKEMEELNKKAWAKVFLISSIEFRLADPTSYFRVAHFNSPFDTSAHAVI